MHLIYFDENKHSNDSPYFFIGGYLVSEEYAIRLDDRLTEIQKSFFGSTLLVKKHEFHGKDMFHGKGNYKQVPCATRMQLFADLVQVYIDFKLPIRIVRINVIKHNNKYSMPYPIYRLGLMLVLERMCDYLDSCDEIGMVHGDIEKDELSKAVQDFSSFKFNGKTPMYFGRPLGRLVDTVHFTHSHHSRFLQLADVLIYLVGRCTRVCNTPSSWPDKKVIEFVKEVWANTDAKIQHWP